MKNTLLPLALMLALTACTVPVTPADVQQAQFPPQPKQAEIDKEVNAYLKVIADLAEIQKELTHHVARHTCATTILLSNGVPIEAVSKWLGHTNIKTTQIYAKITDQYLHQMAKRVDLKLESRVEKSSNL
jgi:site-specific recombinase XerD